MGGEQRYCVLKTKYEFSYNDISTYFIIMALQFVYLQSSLLFIKN